MRILRRKYSFSELYILRKSFLQILLSPKKLLNFFLVELSLFFKLRKCIGMPMHINIEPTVRCNYRCVKCKSFSDIYRDDGLIFGSSDMPFSHYCKIIDEIGETLLTLRLWHFGEPLFNNNIFQMVRYAKKKNIIVAISSNLSLLNKEGAEKLVNSGSDYLVVSFDAGSKETYFTYHGKDYFDRVVDNIQALIETRKHLKKSTPLIELQFIVMKENEKEISKIKELSVSLGVDKMTFLRIHKDGINFKKFSNFYSENDILPENNNFVLDKRKIKCINGCQMPWSWTVIRYSGIVIPCVEDMGQVNRVGVVFDCGNYFGFRRIWNSSSYMDFRYQVAKNINGVDCCFNCAQRDNNYLDQIENL